MRSGYCLSTALLEFGVPLPSMSDDELDELALACLGEARRTRPRLELAPLYLLRATEQPGLCIWVHEVIARGVVGDQVAG